MFVDTRKEDGWSQEMGDEQNFKTAYELIQLIASLNETKKAILLALAHVHPRSVSGVQLSRLIGYSGKSRSLYRGVLAQLKEEELILIDQLTPKLYAIRINSDHPLLSLLVSLSKKYGKATANEYLWAMENDSQS